MYQSILVPVDGSSYAEKAVQVAQRLADASATLYLIHAQRGLDDGGLLMGGSGLPVNEETIQRLAREREAEARAVLEKAHSTVSRDGVAVKTIVAKGRPAEAIVEEAKALGVDAIVMGSRGMSDLQGMVIGSVSHRVSHTAGCTVITVH